MVSAARGAELASLLQDRL